MSTMLSGLMAESTTILSKNSKSDPVISLKTSELPAPSTQEAV